MKIPGTKPYINLDSAIDINSLIEIRDEIILGIAKSSKSRLLSRAGSSVARNNSDLKETHEFMDLIENNQIPELKDFFKNNPMSLQEKLQFVKYRFKTAHMNEFISIRKVKEVHEKRTSQSLPEKLGQLYTLKSTADNTEDSTSAVHFQALLNWLKKSGIFAEIGTVIAFLTDRGESSPLHRDYVTANTNDEFIWINCSIVRKNFFVYDDSFREKFYPEGKVIYFNNSNYHGSDPSDGDSFSIRVNGLFSPRIKKYISEHGG